MRGECSLHFRLPGTGDGERRDVVRREYGLTEDAADRARVETGVTRSGRLVMEWGSETDEDVALVEERDKGRGDVERRDRE